MIDALVSAVERLGLTPTHLVAIVLGLVISWGVTQACKAGFGLHGKPAAFVAFVLGFAATYTTAPGWGWLAFWMAVAVGLTAPSAYKALKFIARKRGWGWFEALSGDPKPEPKP